RAERSSLESLKLPSRLARQALPEIAHLSPQSLRGPEDRLMPRSRFDTRVDRLFETSTRRSRRKRRRAGAGFLLGAERLEGRTLLSTVTVHIFDFDFGTNVKGQPIVDPTINVGDTVHWVWDEGFHSTTSVAGVAEQWNSGTTSTVGHT